MKAASGAYQQEEVRELSDRKRVQAILGPFPVALGLDRGLGEFWQTEPGEEPGSLKLQAGYRVAGSWLSPIGPVGPPQPTALVVFWQEEVDYLRPQVAYRTAARYQEVMTAPWRPVSSGQQTPVEAYLQLRVDFGEPSRSWAVDTTAEADEYTAWAVETPTEEQASLAVAGRFPGVIRDLTVVGEVTLQEEELLEVGKVRYGLTAEQMPVSGGPRLRVAGLQRWLQPAGEWWGSCQLRLCLGLEIAPGMVEWQEVYQGRIQQLQAELGWGKKAGVLLQTQDLILTLLKRKVGTPAADGRRQPFLCGYYRLAAEWQATTPEQVTEPVKTGSGTAQLVILAEDYHNLERDVTYRVEIETSGEIGEATFRWSRDGGRSWEKAGQRTTGVGQPYHLENNLWLYWWGGEGPDLIAGDRWDFTGRARRQHYYLPGAPFQEISWVRRQEEEVVPELLDLETGELILVGPASGVTARVVKDATTHPADIIAALLKAAGLEEALDQEDYRLCKLQTPAYNFGVCFENLPVLTALRKVAAACLYDFWVEAGKIRLRAYLGED